MGEYFMEKKWMVIFVVYHAVDVLSRLLICQVELIFFFSMPHF